MYTCVYCFYEESEVKRKAEVIFLFFILILKMFFNFYIFYFADYDICIHRLYALIHCVCARMVDFLCWPTCFNAVLYSLLCGPYFFLMSRNCFLDVTVLLVFVFSLWNNLRHFFCHCHCCCCRCCCFLCNVNSTLRTLFMSPASQTCQLSNSIIVVTTVR